MIEYVLDHITNNESLSEQLNLLSSDKALRSMFESICEENDYMSCNPYDLETSSAQYDGNALREGIEACVIRECVAMEPIVFYKLTQQWSDVLAGIDMEHLRPKALAGKLMAELTEKRKPECVKI